MSNEEMSKLNSEYEEGLPDQAELKDVIHLYLGCEVGLSGTITHFKLEAVYKDKVAIREYNRRFKNYVDFKNIKPILRKLESMTEEDKLECGKRQYPNVPGFKVEPDEDDNMRPKTFLYLLSKGFDLFNLIENNLAIDKNAKP